MEFEEDVFEQVCEKCENYRNGFDGPYCLTWNDSPSGPCKYWILSDFWETKRGY